MKTLKFMRFMCAFGLTAMVSACSDPEPTAESVAASYHPLDDARASELATLIDARRNNLPPYAGLPEVPIVIACMEEANECDVNRLAMIQDWPKAWEGDYQAQRNVAYMLSRPTVGVPPNPIQGCAWRQIIISTGHIDLNSSDAANMDSECGALSATERQSADAAAVSIGEKIKTMRP